MSDVLIDRLFLGAGAMKAGTTWLYAMLTRHPDIYFTPEKELHYFYARHVRPDVLSEERRIANAARYVSLEPQRAAVLRNRLRWTANYLDTPVDDHWYRMVFALRPPGTWAADFSNLYALLPERAWSRIASEVPHLRVIYTMRDPIERLWSHAKFHLRITGQSQVLETWTTADLVAFVRQPFIWENAEYGAAVRRMKAALPKDTLKLLFHEDIHADEPAALARIERFLGVPPLDYPETALARKLNTTTPGPVPAEFRARLSEDTQRIERELRDVGLSVPDAWQRHSLETAI